MARGLRTTTVGQLLEILQDQDPEKRVVFSADYGDRGHTAQALPIRGEVDTVTVTESGYSNSGYAIAEPDDEDDTEVSGETFLVIR